MSTARTSACFSLSGALTLAQAHEKDLVEIDPESTPPLCQAIDYGKYQFQVQERRKWRRHE
jgi:translation initiation factor IF-3